MPEEKLVFLKREEIKTMAKDMARLLEQEALREKERVGQLKVEEKLKKETLERQKLASTMIPKAAPAEEKIPEQILPAKTLRRGPWRKILVRVSIVLSFLFFLLSIVFCYWYFLVRPRETQPSPPPAPSITFSPTASPIIPSVSPSPAIIPEPLIKTGETKIIKILPSNNLLSQLEQVFSENSPQFSQLAVQKDEKFLGFGELLTELQVKTPDNVLEPVKEEPENFTFFLYVGQNGPRLGFVVRLKEESENMPQNLKAWETTMASDFNDILVVLGKKKPAPDNIFREAKHNDVSFRYLSLAEKNLGLCWAIRHNYLILTTSGESLLETVNYNIL